jgi:hypothetical protein
VKVSSAELHSKGTVSRGVTTVHQHLDSAAADERSGELRHQAEQALTTAASYKPGSVRHQAAAPLAALLRQALTLMGEAHVARLVAEQATAAERDARERSEAQLLNSVSEQAARMRQLEAENAALREKVRQYSEAVMPESPQQQVIRVSGKLPYGYTRAPGGAPVEEPEQALAVRLIFELHQGGMSLRKIAAHLTSEGIGTPRAEQERWQASSVRQILNQRAIYEGKTGYPAIIE